MRIGLERHDWLLGALHVIVRRYRGDRQYGLLLWGERVHTLDVWLGRRLLTFRRRTW